MAIITISRSVFSRGAVVAEKVAERLRYHCISNEVLTDTSRRYDIAETKLKRAIHNAPSIFEKFTAKQQRLIAYVAAEILTNFKKDNVVYHGPAGHFFASNVSPATAKILAYFQNDNVLSHGGVGHAMADDITHLLNVRIVSSIEERKALAMDTMKIDEDHAEAYLKKEDRHRNAWSRQFYGCDDTDLTLYDLVVHINKLSLDDAVDLICETVTEREQFKSTEESQQAIENLAMAAGIKAVLLREYPHCEVVAKGSTVKIFTRFTVHSDTAMMDRIKDYAGSIPGVSEVSVVLIPSILFS